MESLKSHGKWYAAVPVRGAMTARTGDFSLWAEPGAAARSGDYAGKMTLVECECKAEDLVSVPTEGMARVRRLAPVRRLDAREAADAIEREYASGLLQALFLHDEVERIIKAYSLKNAPSNVRKRVSGYKALPHDLVSQWGHMRYKVGKEYDMGGIVAPCNRGYHFCRRLMDVFDYIVADAGTRLFVVEAWGRVQDDPCAGNKTAATGIKLVRELDFSEAYDIVRDAPAGRGHANKLQKSRALDSLGELMKLKGQAGKGK